MADCGQSNGAASIAVTGGAGYCYSCYWGYPINSYQQSVGGLAKGHYGVMVTDDNGCTARFCCEIMSPKIELMVSYNEPSGPGECDGSASVIASETQPPYTYLWSNGDTTSEIIDLCDTFYEITVMDNNGCIEYGSTEPPGHDEKIDSVKIVTGIPENTDTTIAIISMTVGYYTGYQPSYFIIDGNDITIFETFNHWSFIGPPWKSYIDTISLGVLETGTYNISIELNYLYFDELCCANCLRLLDTVSFSSYIDSITIVDPVFQKENLIRIFPNPAQEYVNIEYEIEDQEPVFLEMINMQGIAVFRKEFLNGRTRISIDQYNPGLYIFRIASADSIIYKKLIIK